MAGRLRGRPQPSCGAHAKLSQKWTLDDATSYHTRVIVVCNANERRGEDRSYRKETAVEDYEAFDVDNEEQQTRLRALEGITLLRFVSDGGDALDRFYTYAETAFGFAVVVQGDSSVFGAADPGLGEAANPEFMPGEDAWRLASVSFVRNDAAASVPVLVEPGDYAIVLSRTESLGHAMRSERIVGLTTREKALARVLAIIQVQWSAGILGSVTIVAPSGNSPFYAQGA